MSDSISPQNPIRLYPDGNFWVALIGEDLQAGLSGFGKTPESAIAALMEKDEALALLPHAATEVACPFCSHSWIAVHPFPFAGRLTCPQCFCESDHQIEAL